MSPSMTLALTALIVGLGAYTTLCALTWSRRLLAERPARRRGMILNFVRRAGPPVLAGGVVLLLGFATGSGPTGLPAALLAVGGLGSGLHRGLSEVRLNDRRAVAVRAALSVAAATGYLWLAGLAAASPA